MSRIVVMDRELHEAITVVEIAASFIRAVEQGFHPPRIRVAVKPELRSPLTIESSEMLHYQIVTLSLERVCRGRDPRPLFWYAYPDDPELALKLRAAFLPGQMSEVQRLQAEAYWRGLFAGVAL